MAFKAYSREIITYDKESDMVAVGYAPIKDSGQCHRFLE